MGYFRYMSLYEFRYMNSSKSHRFNNDCGGLSLHLDCSVRLTP